MAFYCFKNTVDGLLLFEKHGWWPFTDWKIRLLAFLLFGKHGWWPFPVWETQLMAFYCSRNTVDGLLLFGKHNWWSCTV